VLVGVEGGQDDDLGRVAAGAQGLGGGQPVHRRHADVHEDHVGGVPVDHRQDLGAVAGLGDHADVGAPPSIITRPARTSGSSSTTSTPTGGGLGAQA
jgi:hypothetical protein